MNFCGVTSAVFIFGRLWIDRKSFHWLRAEAQVLNPVSVFGLFARVLPGTRMELNMAPVTDSIWPASAVLAEALANEKDEP
jgi:hypothetical protein